LYLSLIPNSAVATPEFFLNPEDSAEFKFVFYAVKYFCLPYSNYLLS